MAVFGNGLDLRNWTGTVADLINMRKKVKMFCIKKWIFLFCSNFFIWIVIKNDWCDIKNKNVGVDFENFFLDFGLVQSGSSPNRAYRSQRSWASDLVVQGLSGYFLFGLRWGPHPVGPGHGRSMTQQIISNAFLAHIYIYIYIYIYPCYLRNIYIYIFFSILKELKNIQLIIVDSIFVFSYFEKIKISLYYN